MNWRKPENQWRLYWWYQLLWYWSEPVSQVPWPSKTIFMCRVTGNGNRGEQGRHRKILRTRGRLGQKFILILSENFQKVRIHMCHFYDLLETMKFVCFLRYSGNIIMFVLVRLCACYIHFILSCQLHVCFLETCLTTSTRQTSAYFLLMHWKLRDLATYSSLLPNLPTS